MKTTSSYKSIIILSIITVTIGFIYIIIYPLVKPVYLKIFKKEPVSVVYEVKVDKEFFKKVEKLKDNTVTVNESWFNIKENPFKNF